MKRKNEITASSDLAQHTDSSQSTFESVKKMRIANEATNGGSEGSSNKKKKKKKKKKSNLDVNSEVSPVVVLEREKGGTSPAHSAEVTGRSETKTKTKVSKHAFDAGGRAHTLSDGTLLEAGASTEALVPKPPSGAAKKKVAKQLRLDKLAAKAQKPVKTVKMTDHPFTADYCDHFETPLVAYQDIQPILNLLAKRLSKKPQNLRIWDPYFCEGQMVGHMAALGFPNVYHKNEDFYAVVKEGRAPPFDVLITNPPYSVEHKQRCLEYCSACGKPWLLLMPNYIANKEYYRKAVTQRAGAAVTERAGAASGASLPFYVVPGARYEYGHPEGTGHETSPFDSMWYVQLGEWTDNIFSSVPRPSKTGDSAGVTLIRTIEGLAAKALVPTAKRMNPRQRKAIAKKLAQASGS